MAQWWRIKEAYLKGDMSLSELAKKYHVGVSTIKKHASNEGWKSQRDQINTEASQAVRARAREEKEQQLLQLITAQNDTMEALVKLAAKAKNDPEKYLIDDKGSLKNAESLAKAIQTAAMTQRDLHKLPTLDQDMQKKAEAQRKREAKEKANLDREKFEFQKQKEELAASAGSVTWQINLPPEIVQQGVELDG